VPRRSAAKQQRGTMQGAVVQAMTLKLAWRPLLITA
jgi:hypothetical protein